MSESGRPQDLGLEVLEQDRSSEPRPKPPPLQPAQVLLDLESPPIQPLTHSSTHHHHPPPPTTNARARAREAFAHGGATEDTLVRWLTELGFVGARPWVRLGWDPVGLAELITQVVRANEHGTVRNPPGLVRHHARKQWPDIEPLASRKRRKRKEV